MDTALTVSWGSGAIQLALLAILPPLVAGAIGRVKAAIGGRTGAPVWQPWFDLWRLARKGVVISHTTTFVYLVAPIVAWVAFLAAGLFVPAASLPGVFGFPGDSVLFVYLLALGRFATVLAALDTGSSFAGMGVSRELTFAVFSEGTIFFALLTLARVAETSELGDILISASVLVHEPGSPALLLVAAALFVVTLAEACRIPVDDPATHLELTMIHEVMVLDASGPLLALWLHGAQIKLYALAAMIVQVLFPFTTGSLALDIVAFVAEVFAIALIIGLVESTMARLRLVHVPRFLVSAALLALLAYLLVT